MATARPMSEPIAIIGLGCRFPGAAEGPEAFWRLLAAGVDAVATVPADRWDADAFYDPDPVAPGKMSTRWGGFLEGIDRFDHAFFGMAKREASAMDPQQRLMLEVAWQAFEDAGQGAAALAGSRTGVYMGVFGQDFQGLMVRDLANINAYSPTGNVLCVGVNRLSNYFDLIGPSMAIDTGCSSSLVAVHQACLSLRAGETDLALAGGVNVVLAPEPVIALSKAWMMASDGRCKAFDAAADGYVRGEGCGMVVLKRLADARRDGDRILAVIRGSAVNQDGRGQGLTAPNPASQARVVSEALAAAGVAPRELAYVETHGSGTALGDPIEIRALASVFAGEGACLLGSVKTNIGHLETAAGIAGLIKALLVLRHGQVPPHLHLRTPNPALGLASTPFAIPTALTPLPVGSRLAGVSSFGLGGTNAHAVLEAPPAVEPAPAPALQVLALSAKTEAALAALVALHAERLADLPPATWPAWCHAAARRTAHGHRLAVVADGPAAAAAALAAWKPGQPALLGTAGSAAADAFVAGGPPPDAQLPLAALGAVDLPPYPFQRERAWFGAEEPEAALRWSATSPAWLADHRVGDAVIVPAAAWLALALARAVRLPGSGVPALEGWRFLAPLALGPAAAAVAVQANGAKLQLVAGRTVHAEGQIRRLAGEAPATEGPLALLAGLGEHVDGAAFYDKLAARGIAFGPIFRGIETLWRGGREALARLAPCPAGQALEAPRLDAWLQVVGATLPDEAWHGDQAWVPAALERVAVWGDAAAVRWVHARLTGPGETAVLTCMDDAGRVCARVEGLRMQALGAAAPPAPTPAGRGLYAVAWEPAPDLPAATNAGRWLVVGNPAGGGMAGVLAGALAAVGGLAVPVAADRGTIAAALAVGGPWRGVIDLGPLHADPRDPVAAAHAVAAGTLAVLQGVAEGPPGARVFTVTAGAVAGADAPVAPWQAPAWGLARVAAQELPRCRPVSVDLGPNGAPELAALIRELVADAPEDQVLLAGGRRRVARFRPQALSSHHPMRIEIGQPGSLAHLRAVPAARPDPGPGEVEVAVEAAGLNFRDVMHAMGVYPGDAIALGAEGCGRVTRVGPGVTELAVGMRVFGLMPGAFATYVLTDARLVQALPQALEPAQAAAFPVAFLTAHYALGHLGRLAPGERVLIHAAAGGVGLAAVALARRAGATVYATAGSERKRAYLRSLGIQHVYDSRSLAFADAILADTGGEGVDVVLNSLAGEYIPRSLELLRVGGRFLEIGKHDIYGDAALALGAFRKNLGFQSIDLDLVSRRQPGLVQALFAELVGAATRGELAVPMPQRYPLAELAAGFEHLRGRESIGKIVFELPEVREAAPPIRAGGHYLVTGGLGALGLATAAWLAEQGAGGLTLTGRRAPDAAASQSIEALRARGVAVAVVQADVARREDVARVLAGLPAPLAGIFHLAGVLDDGVLHQQDARRLAAVLAPKVDGAWHLHELSAGLPLERFVLFSSVASVLGPPGQGTYASANAFLDALAHHRRQQGLPAQSINWGPWAEAGMAAGHTGRMAARGVGAWTQADGLERLHDVLLGAGAQVAAIDLEPATWLAATPQLASWPFLAALVPAGRAVVAEPAGGWREQVIAAAPSERGRAMERLLVELVATVLNQPAAAIDPLAPLAELGLDSLLGLELRSRLGLATGLELPATLAWTYPTVAALATFLAAQLIPAEAPAPAPAAPAAERPLSAAEAEALLLAELESLEALKEAWS